MLWQHHSSVLGRPVFYAVCLGCYTSRRRCVGGLQLPWCCWHAPTAWMGALLFLGYTSWSHGRSLMCYVAPVLLDALAAQQS
jgi:hypothetical protein